MNGAAFRPYQLLTVVLLLLGTAASLRAQDPVTVQGRVVHAEDSAPIAGATIEFGGFQPRLTDDDGRFRFAGVIPGRYALIVTGLGYARIERSLIIQNDTTITVQLQPQPVRLDTLAVEGRTITLRGEVKEHATGISLIDVDVVAGPGQQTLTDPLGRFRLNDVPANVPVTVAVREFGYLPVTATVTAGSDTTLLFELEPDPVVARMISLQKARIAERAGEQRYGFDDVIDRPILLRNLNGTPGDLIARILGARAQKIRCIVIDEQRLMGSGGGPSPIRIGARRRTVVVADMHKLLSHILPDRIEYIEVLKFGRQNEDLMIRVYTREFIQRMTGGAEELVPLERIIEGAHIGLCR